jgi:hypothetical protein
MVATWRSDNLQPSKSKQKDIGNEQGEKTNKPANAASTGDCLPTKLARCDNRRKKQPSFATTLHRASKMAKSLQFMNDARAQSGSKFCPIAQSWSMTRCNSSYSLILIPS